MNNINKIEIIEEDGITKHYLNGKLHRDDGPAVIYESGSVEWYQHGLLHRDNGPASISFNNEQSYYIKGELHRDNGPAVIYSNGEEHWYQHGLLHRDNGPAKIDDDVQSYYVKGILHREDGPAIITPRENQWFLNGREYTEETYNKKIQEFSVKLSQMIVKLREKVFPNKSIQNKL